MDTNIEKLDSKNFPKQLKEIPDCPDKLYVRGTLPDKDMVLLTVVGSRKHSSYGRQACEELISGLSGYNICIVSGLALGVDSIAHTEALKAGLKTIAVPGSGLDWKVLYPATNYNLAKRIIDSGGALVSEFEPDFRATPWSFPQRNRIMAGLAQAVLVIEAGQRSGTLITARLALDYNRDVFVVPGSIFSEGATGTHKLLRQGATPVTASEDILDELGFDISEGRKPKTPESPEEKQVMELLIDPLPRDELIRQLNVQVSRANELLSVMEIKGLIKESLGLIHRA